MSYCTTEKVNSLFGDISDDISSEMFETVIENSTAWIDNNLKRAYIPIPDIIPAELQTAAIYYAASDILLSLYHGDELPAQYDVWFQKAQAFLEAYIEAYNHAEAEQEDLVNQQMVKHSHGRTYNQKRGRGRRWVR